MIRFAVHRIVMVSASDYFHALLGPNFEEGTENEVLIGDVNGQTLKSIIDFCYSGEIGIQADNVESILAAASKMAMIDIETMCEQYLHRRLSIENLVDAFMLADKYSLVELRRRSFDELCRDFESATDSQIQKLSAPQLTELLQSDNVAASEDDICRKVIGWIDHEESRSNDAPDILKIIRLEHISVQVQYIQANLNIVRFCHSIALLILHY